MSKGKSVSQLSGLLFFLFKGDLFMFLLHAYAEDLKKSFKFAPGRRKIQSKIFSSAITATHTLLNPNCRNSFVSPDGPLQI